VWVGTWYIYWPGRRRTRLRTCNKLPNGITWPRTLQYYFFVVVPSYQVRIKRGTNHAHPKCKR
jgi:hypothetical protein